MENKKIYEKLNLAYNDILHASNYLEKIKISDFKYKIDKENFKSIDKKHDALLKSISKLAKRIKKQ